MYLGKLYSKKELEIPLSEMEGVPNDETATIKIRLLTDGEQRKVADAAFEHTLGISGSGDDGLRVGYKPRQVIEKTFMQAVIGWKNFFEDKDCTKPLVFNEPNKRRLLDLWPALGDFVATRHGEMAREAEEAKEEEEKNS